jgi:hypothetical protein
MVYIVPVNDLAGRIKRKKAGLCGHHIIAFSVAAGFENLVSPKGNDGIDGNSKGRKEMGCRVIAKGSAVCGADDIFVLHLELANAVSREWQVIRTHVVGGEEAAVEAVQAFRRGNPDITERILYKADDVVIAEAFVAGIAGEAGACGGLGGRLGQDNLVNGNDQYQGQKWSAHGLKIQFGWKKRRWF